MSNYKDYINFLKGENKGKNINAIFDSLNKNDQLMLIMFKYTEAFFEFLYFFCKDNIIIKMELYNYLHIFFFFINISQNCIKCFFEIIKDNPNLIREICKDCKRDVKFKQSLFKINQQFLNITQDLNIINLIFEYIKISKYENEQYKEYNKATQDFIKDSKVFID